MADFALKLIEDLAARVQSETVRQAFEQLAADLQRNTDVGRALIALDWKKHKALIRGTVAECGEWLNNRIGIEQRLRDLQAMVEAEGHVGPTRESKEKTS